MWVLQNDVLMELPDDVPMPPNGKKVDVPADFLVSPRDYKIKNGALLHEPQTLVVALLPQLTSNEIQFIKELAAKNAPAPAPVEDSARKPGRRKEKK